MGRDGHESPQTGTQPNEAIVSYHLPRTWWLTRTPPLKSLVRRDNQESVLNTESITSARLLDSARGLATVDRWARTLKAE